MLLWIGLDSLGSSLRLRIPVAVIYAASLGVATTAFAIDIHRGNGVRYGTGQVCERSWQQLRFKRNERKPFAFRTGSRRFIVGPVLGMRTGSLKRRLPVHRRPVWDRSPYLKLDSAGPCVHSIACKQFAFHPACAPDQRPASAASSYLNAKPLIYGLEEAGHLSLTLDVPAKLIDGLRDRRFDVALLPIIDYQRLSDARLLTAGGIGCDGPTLTVRIFSHVPVEQIATLACDVHSHSSVAFCAGHPGRAIWPAAAVHRSRGCGACSPRRGAIADRGQSSVRRTARIDIRPISARLGNS